MERFVGLLTGGGLALVVGLWLADLFPAGSLSWLLAVALSVLGAGALASGIRSEIDLG